MKQPSDRVRERVVRVLQQVAADMPAELWQIASIGQGDQAELFRAQCGKDLAGEPSAEDVVVKLYKDRGAADRRAFHSEESSLRVLSELLPANVCDGWTILTPALLFSTDQPLALVMSSLPGVSLDIWLHSNVPTPSEAESIVEAMLASLQVLWAQGFMYGDLNLKNILYDATRRTLGFIDPGLPADYYRCEDVGQAWYPMSRDIAYLLFSVAVSVKSTLANPAARRRQLLVVTSFIQRYVQACETRQQQTLLLDEIRLCMETHLRELDSSWSLAGIWRQVVKQIAHSSLNRTLEQLAVQRHEVRS